MKSGNVARSANKNLFTIFFVLYKLVDIIRDKIMEKLESKQKN